MQSTLIVASMDMQTGRENNGCVQHQQENRQLSKPVHIVGIIGR